MIPSSVCFGRLISPATPELVPALASYTTNGDTTAASVCESEPNL
jgi:hypothetical protein